MGNSSSSENNSSLRLLNNRSSTSVNSDISDYAIIPDEEINTKDETINHFSRQEVHYLLKKMLFQCEFSSPVKDRLTRGGKVLDLG